MRVITIWGRDLVFPCLGWSRVRNFENISDEERIEMDKCFQEIEQALKERQEIAVIMQKYRELTGIMGKSNDFCLRALGSQIKTSVLILDKMNGEKYGKN